MSDGPNTVADIDPLLAEVARLRVAGKTWEECAALIPRAVETMRSWSYKRATEWRTALVKAIDDAMGSYENDALLVCQRHLKATAKNTAGDRQLAQVAARDLLHHCRELRGRRLKLELSGPDGGPMLTTTQLIAQAIENGHKPDTADTEDDDVPDGEAAE